MEGNGDDEAREKGHEDDMERNREDEDSERGNEDDMEGNSDDEDREKTDNSDMERSDNEVEDIQEKIDDDTTNKNYALLSSLKHPTDPAHVQKHSIDHSNIFVEFCCFIGPCQPAEGFPKTEGRSFHRGWYQDNLDQSRIFCGK